MGHCKRTLLFWEQRRNEGREETMIIYRENWRIKEAER
jgi:hypothetical protein